MRGPKILFIFALGLFGVIGLLALFRSGGESPVVEVNEVATVAADPLPPTLPAALPDADLMDQFFNINNPKLPIVETVTYSRKVPWLQGKAAWVSDYAAHYGTSRHFIARSLNGAADYEKQDVANGDHFNVFRADRPISFHLVVDTSRCRMWVYYHDEVARENVLVKTYDVGLGRLSDHLESGSLTPLGTYKLGDRVAIYRPGKIGTYNGDRIEMISVFGTRWIPFGESVGAVTAPAKGLGLHGCPWVNGREDASGIGGYESDGCIRLKTEDMEELFAVIITKPTEIHLVKDFAEAKLP